MTGAQGCNEDMPQQDLATSARVSAERAREHFLARRAQRSAIGIEKPLSNSCGSGMPTLLVRRSAEAVGTASSAHLPVLLGHAEAAVEVAAPAPVQHEPAHVDVDGSQGNARALAEMA